MLYHLLSGGQEAFTALAGALEEVPRTVGRCNICRAYLESDRPCPYCDDSSRDASILCVVESPADLYLIESTGEYAGLYHVLHGLLSPVRGYHSEQLGIDALAQRVSEGAVREVILATPPTAEGEATASFVASVLEGKAGRVTRIGFGLPVGSDFSYVDSQTLSRALSGRRDFR